MKKKKVKRDEKVEKNIEKGNGIIRKLAKKLLAPIVNELVNEQLELCLKRQEDAAKNLEKSFPFFWQILRHN